MGYTKLMRDAPARYRPDRWVAGASFASAVIAVCILPTEDVLGSLLGFGLCATLDFGVWRSRGWAFALNAILSLIGLVFLFFEPVGWRSLILEFLPGILLGIYGVLRLGGRLGPPPIRRRPFAHLGERVSNS